MADVETPVAAPQATTSGTAPAELVKVDGVEVNGVEASEPTSPAPDVAEPVAPEPQAEAEGGPPQEQEADSAPEVPAVPSVEALFQAIESGVLPRDKAVAWDFAFGLPVKKAAKRRDTDPCMPQKPLRIRRVQLEIYSHLVKSHNVTRDDLHEASTQGKLPGLVRDHFKMCACEEVAGLKQFVDEKPREITFLFFNASPLPFKDPAVPPPARSIDVLVEAIKNDTLPTPYYVRDDYGFTRTSELEEQGALLKLYAKLLEVLKGDREKIHEACKADKLAELIEIEFEKIPEEEEIGEWYDFFLDNEHIVANGGRVH